MLTSHSFGQEGLKVRIAIRQRCHCGIVWPYANFGLRVTISWFRRDLFARLPARSGGWKIPGNPALDAFDGLAVLEAGDSASGNFALCS
jgi:hypothetical protein